MELCLVLHVADMLHMQAADCLNVEDLASREKGFGIIAYQSVSNTGRSEQVSVSRQTSRLGFDKRTRSC